MLPSFSRADMDKLWDYLQDTDSCLDSTEWKVTEQRGHLNVLNEEVDELNQTVNFLRSQLGKIVNASFSGKERSCHVT